MSADSNTTKAQKQKLVRAIARGGYANEALGWLWLANGVFWAFLYFLFSSPHSSNPIIGAGSVLASFDNSTLLLFVVTSLILGVVHIGISAYIRMLRGPRTKTFLLIGGIAAAIFFLSIVPVIPAILSLYGYYAARKVGRLANPKSVKSLRLVTLKNRVIVAAVLIVLAIGLSLIASVRLHQFNSQYDTPNGGQSSQIAIKESNESYSSTRVVGYCAVNPSPRVGCRYVSKDDGFTATFPANSAFLGTPLVHNDTRHRYVNKTASAKTIKSLTGYAVNLLYFTNSVSRPDDIQQKLHASADDKYINTSCIYNPSNDATQEVVTATTYDSSPALNVNTVGTSYFQNEPCHYYSLAFTKGNTVYVLSATAIGTSKYAPTQESFNRFVANFQLKN